MARLFALRRLILGALALAALAWIGRAPAERLRSRLPDPLNRNRHILVITDCLREPPLGTPLVRTTPALEVLGVVEAVTGDADVPAPGDYVLRVSIFPAGERVIRDDAEISLRESTPDLLEIVTTYLTPERRAVIAERMRGWYRAHERAIGLAMERTRELASRELGADELGARLTADPDVRAAVYGAVEREVTSRIDWDRTVERALASRAADTAGQLAFEAGPFAVAWAGLREGYSARWHELWSGGSPPGAEREPDGFLNPFSLFVPRWSNARRAAAHRAGADIARAYPRYREELAGEVEELAGALAREEELEDKGLNAARALAADPELREVLRSRYGPEALERLGRLGAAMADDPELKMRLSVTIDSGLELFARFLRELSLDDRGEGLNPLLAAFLRARLLGKTEPVLIVDGAGVGAPVREGQVFVSRAR